MKNRRAGRWVVLLTVLVLAVAACGGGEPDAGASPSGTVESPSPDEESPEPATPAEEAVAALERYLAYRDEAIIEGKLDLERLNEVAAGRKFLDFQHEIAQNHEWGHDYAGEYTHELGEPRRESDGTYVIFVCEDISQVTRTNADDEAVVVMGPDGEPEPDRQKIEYQIEAQNGGRWLVTLDTWPVDENGERTLQSC